MPDSVKKHTMSVKRSGIRSALALFLMTILLCGCRVDVSMNQLKEVQSRLQLAWDALQGKSAEVKKSGPSMTAQQRELQESTKLLHEMFQVVWLREPYGHEEFNGYVNALSQGGSLEGIYNGFVNSSQYRKMEESSPPADPATIEVFSELIASFQRDLEHSTIRPTDLDVSPPYETVKYEQVFARASLFRLKRILGNEALKVLEAKRARGEAPDALAHWYANWVSQMAKRKVDFGLPLRNDPDPTFHLKWVKSLPSDVAVDRITWEVLVRVHRLLNATEAAAMKGGLAKGHGVSAIQRARSLAAVNAAGSRDNSSDSQPGSRRDVKFEEYRSDGGSPDATGLSGNASNVIVFPGSKKAEH